MFQQFGQLRPGVPGDNGPDKLRPEIVAAEQRILTCADALLIWMKEMQPWEPRVAGQIDAFMAHQARNPLHRRVEDVCDDAAYAGKITSFVLDKMDPDANRMMFELLRAAWERRCWQALYGERQDPRA
jgi:hypothetical protein